MVEVLFIFVCPTFPEVHQNEVRASDSIYEYGKAA